MGRACTHPHPAMLKPKGRPDATGHARLPLSLPLLLPLPLPLLLLLLLLLLLRPPCELLAPAWLAANQPAGVRELGGFPRAQAALHLEAAGNGWQTMPKRKAISGQIGRAARKQAG